ncbi:glycoside hydrolase family 27 protein [Sphingomonas sp.]|uniref:glycoside hydrolase family 27 protein n=1 Tax=Sphingomonas sp. TaxID=28214 RepID=UPI003AFF9DE3
MRRWARTMVGRVACGAVAVALLGGPTSVAAAAPLPAAAPMLAATPPMGWNSWNRFQCNIDEAKVRAVADAMVASGMRDAGYRYVVVDDCWQGARDADGFITADAARFPAGIKALADYVHARGLLFGIYSDAGAKTCGGRPGSQGHEYQDALTYARWGVDYLKYDWCETGPRNAEEAYRLIERAIAATARPILLSLCEWGTARPWLWTPTVGQMWRTTGDITDKWDGKHDYAYGVTAIVDLNEPLWPFAGRGHWNDPDMLEVGNGGLSDTEYRAHFSLWAMMAAPLIAGNDLAAMNAATREILTNREVIAVDQDALGQQGHRVARDGDRETWVKPLSGGRRAVLLFNRGARSARIVASWDQLGYPPTLTARVRDLWAHRDLPRATGLVAATVAPHGVAMLVIAP